MAPKSRTAGGKATGKGRAKGTAKVSGKGKAKAQAQTRDTKRAAGGQSSSRAGEEFTMTVNRAPLLALWVASCMECCGYDREAALTMGKAASVLGIATKAPKMAAKGPPGKRAGSKPGEEEVQLGRLVIKTVETDEGPRAINPMSGRPLKPEPIKAQLERAFGEHLETVRTAMIKTCKTYKPKELLVSGMDIYNDAGAFRPGRGEFGDRGLLQLSSITNAAKR